MTWRLIFTDQYTRRAARFLKRHPEMVGVYSKALHLLEANPHHLSLRLHAPRYFPCEPFCLKLRSQERGEVDHPGLERRRDHAGGEAALDDDMLLHDRVFLAVHPNDVLALRLDVAVLENPVQVFHACCLIAATDEVGPLPQARRHPFEARGGGHLVSPVLVMDNLVILDQGAQGVRKREGGWDGDDGVQAGACRASAGG